MRVIAFTGMPGSGKSEAMAVAATRELPVVRMGDLVWEEVERRGLPLTAEHVGPTANAMREEHGPDVWALRTVDRINRDHADSPVVLVDGVRSLHEVEVFRRELGEQFCLVAIHTDAHARHGRLTTRARDDDPTDVAEHEARDEREMGWGIARAIALADRVISNDATLDEFKSRVTKLLDDLA